ncbi:MAG: hypothetical protein AB7I19_11195 [Planctomycetota bacterium]
MNAFLRSIASTAALASVLLAQNPEDLPGAPLAPQGGDHLGAVLPRAAAAPGASRDAAQTLGTDIYTCPIRSGQDDNGYTYGTWASGPNYKASFHDGFAFYPVLGTRYPSNLPLAWRTVGASIGQTELLGSDEQALPNASDWRFEYRFTNFTEAYDLLPTGVEQTFVFASKPEGDGDLVVRGRVTTELHASPRGPLHGAIDFVHADGTQILKYGAATAIDADGRRFPMDSAFANGEITLRLAGSVVAEARFPLVVDPLVGSTIVAFDSSNRQASQPDLARDDTANQLLVSYSRATSGSDYDAFARLFADDFSGTSIVWNDLTASWSTRLCDTAFVGGPDRWIIVVQRDFPSPTGSWIRFHTRASADAVLSSAWTALAGSNGNSLTNLDVGGTDAFSTGNNALVVYQSDVGLTNSSTSEVFAQLVDVVNNTVGAPIDLEPAVNRDRETPSVNQVSDGGTASWICCWTQVDNTITDDDWDLIIRRIDSTGTSRGRSFLGNGSASVHAYRPKIAGRGGRYTAVYGESPNSAGAQANGWAETIWVHRFNWSEVSANAEPLQRVEVRSAGAANFWSGNIAYDNNTDSHWAVVYHGDDWNVYAARVGYNGGVCEAVTVYNTASFGFSPGITFNDDANEFPLVFTATESGAQPQPVYGVRFTYPTFNQPALYGIGCGPGTIGSNSNSHGRKPHCGQEFFEVRVDNLPLNAIGALNIGLSADGSPIAGIPGCFFNVGTLIASLNVAAIGNTATIQLPIPGGISGDVFVQYLYIDPSSPAPIPVSLTRGMQIFIR